MKRAIAIIGVVFFVAIAFIIFRGVRSTISRNIALSNLDNIVRTIELPCTIERIAVRSAVGDSGGNGNFRTLRSVMLIRTYLTRDELISELYQMGLHRIFLPCPHGNFDGGCECPPIRWSTIQEPRSYQFNSSRGFILNFDELKGITMFDGYHFIEFIAWRTW